MMKSDGAGWSLSEVVALQIRRFRRRRDLSREQLAERCQALGAPATGPRSLSAATIANIETGRPNSDGQRRRDVTVDEIAIFAMALGVPPVALLAPVESNEPVEVLPAREVSAWGAVRWFTGLDATPGELEGGPGYIDAADKTARRRDVLPLIMRREHDRLWGIWAATGADATNNRRMAEGAISDQAREEFAREADQAGREAREIEYQLAEHRRYMNRHGVTPPPLPEGLTHVDGLPPRKPRPTPREQDLDAALAPTDA